MVKYVQQQKGVVQMKKMTFTIDDRSARLLAELSEQSGVAQSRIVRWAIQAWYDSWMEAQQENDS